MWIARFPPINAGDFMPQPLYIPVRAAAEFDDQQSQWQLP
jgi:hypothetical protein